MRQAGRNFRTSAAKAKEPYSILQTTVELHKKNYACSFIQSHSATKAVFGIASPIPVHNWAKNYMKMPLGFHSTKISIDDLQSYTVQIFRKLGIKFKCYFKVSWAPFCHISSLDVCSTSLLYYDNECLSQFLLNLILQPLVIRSYPAFISIIREPVKKKSKG